MRKTAIVCIRLVGVIGLLLLGRMLLIAWWGAASYPLHLAVQAYAREHAGRYPESLDVLHIQNPINEWQSKSFYFVSGLRSNDPPHTPLFIYRPLWNNEGMVGWLRRGSDWFPREIVDAFIKEPWNVSLYGDRFAEYPKSSGYSRSLPEEVTTDLKKRLRVVSPTR